MSDDRKDLPPASAPNFNERLRETLQTYLGTRGDKLDRGVTLRDLSEADIITLDRRFLAGTGGRARPIAGPGTSVVTTEPDLTPPPTPSGFSATTSKTSILIVTDPQTYTQGHGHAKTQVFGAKYTGTALTFSDAVILDEFSGDVHAFPVDPASDYRLWVTWVTVDGAVSAPAGGTNGVTATAGLLDDVNIASLTVSKLRSGTLSVGQFAQSSSYVAGSAGWRLNGDGSAEFSNVTVRGGVYATVGQIGGNSIDSSGLQSPGYSPGASGWRLDSGGLLRAFAAGSRVIDMAATGTSPALQFGSQFYVLANGSAYFGGALAANTVTAETIVSQSVGKPFSHFAFPQEDYGTIGASAVLANADGMADLLVIGPRNAVAGYLFGTAGVSGSYLVTGHFGTLTIRLLVYEYSAINGGGTQTVREAIFQTAAADSRDAAVLINASPVIVFAFEMAAATKSVKILLSARNNNAVQVAYLSNLSVAAAVLQK